MKEANELIQQRLVGVKEMKKEQTYQPINRSAFYKKAAKLKIEEPLEELLSMLD